MKKLINISAVIMCIALSATAGAAAAAQAPATSLGTGASSAPAPRVVKDFKAARDLELERSKFQLSALDQLHKCLTAAKEPVGLGKCQATYREAVTANLTSLVAQGKFTAAYESAPRPAEKPTVVPAK